jgi:hypothetical protein
MTNKAGSVSLESIKDQCLIGFGDLCIRRASHVGQVHLGRHYPSGKTGSLDVKPEVHSFERLDTNDKFISEDILENTLGNILELDTNFDIGLIESYGVVLATNLRPVE